MDAIAFGLAMRGIGFNVFVTGMSGTGRLTTIKSFVEKLAEADEKPDDICFVFNFRKPEEPSAIFLKAGAGMRLKEGMNELIDELASNLPTILNDREFRSRIERAVEPLQKKERDTIEAFEKQVGEAGFVLDLSGDTRGGRFPAAAVLGAAVAGSFRCGILVYWRASKRHCRIKKPCRNHKKAKSRVWWLRRGNDPRVALVRLTGL